MNKIELNMAGCVSEVKKAWTNKLVSVEDIRQEKYHIVNRDGKFFAVENRTLPPKVLDEIHIDLSYDDQDSRSVRLSDLVSQDQFNDLVIQISASCEMEDGYYGETICRSNSRVRFITDKIVVPKEFQLDSDMVKQIQDICKANEERKKKKSIEYRKNKKQNEYEKYKAELRAEAVKHGLIDA